MSEFPKSPNPIPMVPQDLWDKAKGATPSEKNRDYPPMEFILEKIAQRVKLTKTFTDQIRFEDTDEMLMFECDYTRVKIHSGEYYISIERRLIYPDKKLYEIGGTTVTKLNNHYHPNFFAFSTIKYIVDYFEDIDPGSQIYQLSAFWPMKLGLNDNYNKFKKTPGGHEAKAFSTHSGKVALFLGFSRIGYFVQDPEDGCIQVIFNKPE